MYIQAIVFTNWECLTLQLFWSYDLRQLGMGEQNKEEDLQDVSAVNAKPKLVCSGTTRGNYVAKRESIPIFVYLSKSNF